jgi:2-polyprenyl-6-methoxyphenol hydroxylase-like FAD-dependent oxidoreductase
MTGLSASRVLADAFEEVVVIDKDPLPDEPVARRAVPQADHVHVLLEAGWQILEDFFPGFLEELTGKGGIKLEDNESSKSYTGGSSLADPPEKPPVYMASRPLMESIVRQRVATLDNIAIQPESQFVEFLYDEESSIITGVKIRDENADLVTYDAELVLDSTGKTSRTPKWLESHGYEAPDVDEISIDLAYSSAYVERPPEDKRSITMRPTPSRPRGGVAVPVEEGRWIVTMWGMHGDHPPIDIDEFEEFAASFPIPDIANILSEHRIISDDADYYPYPSSRRRRYEELDRFPDGLVVAGDAIATFNPTFGQGMSVANLQALELHHTLGAAGSKNLALRFFERAGSVIDSAWRVSAGSDFQFPQTEGPKPEGTDFLNWYISGLTRKAQTDGKLTQALNQVMSMRKPPESLLRPDIKDRVVNSPWEG